MERHIFEEHLVHLLSKLSKIGQEPTIKQDEPLEVANNTGTGIECAGERDEGEGHEEGGASSQAAEDDDEDENCALKGQTIKVEAMEEGERSQDEIVISKAASTAPLGSWIFG